jgi:hypothetical protein
MKEFVISDESENGYGLIVLTSGINTEQFKKNPVMFYNHNREGGVIGRWDNVRKDGDKLLATPIFDESDENGSKIAKKVQDGFIRAASIGIDVTQIEKDKTITTCELIECSICDIPSNGNALMLYHQGNPVKDRNTCIKLKLIKGQSIMSEDELKKILEALGLEPDSSIDSILESINSHQTASNTIEGKTVSETVENAILLNYVKPYEKEGLLQMAKTNTKTFSKYITERKKECLEERKKECLELIEASFKDGRLDRGMRDVKEFWLRVFEYDYEGGKAMLSNLPKAPRLRIMDLLDKPGGKTENKSAWTLNDYRKKAPQELSKDPNLYQRLLDEDRESKMTK